MISLKQHEFINLIFVVFSIVSYASTQPTIISSSANLTVDSNDIVQLPCLVKDPDNTIATWQQCDDVYCNDVRSPITVGKENFVQDLRFRLIFDDKYADDTTGQSNIIDQNNNNNNATSSSSSDFMVDKYKHKVNWMLEIRRFTKNDEACYECQLNTLKQNKIHYCIKLKPKLVITPKTVFANINKKLKIECYFNDVVNFNKIKWYKDGIKLINTNNLFIEKIHVNHHTYTFLTIDEFQSADKGTYMCKFAGIYNETAHVFVHNNVTMKQQHRTLNHNESSSIRCGYCLFIILILYLIMKMNHYI